MERNGTDLIFDDSSSSSPFSMPSEGLDEASYNVFFTTFDPNSPVYSRNITGFGISIGLLKFCLEGVGVTLAATLGVIGNIFSIIVLSSPRMKSSSTCFLLGMAVSDLVTLVGAMAIIGIPSLMAYNPATSEEGTAIMYSIRLLRFGYLLPPIFAIACTALTCSIWFMVTLTLERFLAVCRPLSARSMCTWSRACLVSVLVVATSILYNFPKWFEYTYVEDLYFEDPTNTSFTIYRPVATALRKNYIYDTYYGHISYLILLFLIPISALVGFNILIYRKIKEANKQRKNLSPSQKHEHTLSYILFSVVAVFLCCNLFPAFIAVYRYIEGSREYIPEAEFFWVFTFVLNSSVNFLIYCSTGGKFREIFCDMFCCWRTSSRLRQFAASTKTTFRSLSTSSRSRGFSLYSRRDSSQQIAGAFEQEVVTTPTSGEPGDGGPISIISCNYKV